MANTNPNGTALLEKVQYEDIDYQEIEDIRQEQALAIEEHFIELEMAEWFKRQEECELDLYDRDEDDFGL